MSGAQALADRDDLKLQQRLQLNTARIARVQAALNEKLTDLNLTVCGLFSDFSNNELCQDPYDQSTSLLCEWRDKHNNLLGSLQLHDSGRVFAEYDVIKPHPTKPKWFIEAVTAWGDDEQLRTELRLLPMR
ncbi:hypothetical protein [Thalassolituus sp.]|jgi:hypothetical protein|uniref:hypothetical protein n=1 Tax=Thalassolituus sp. TaxID=2030822 RepID=UPI002A80321E|nr:hypothetical protein [Thalassolituus sp.]|tara:strand:- start:11843 stop:12235 length:393 start_codon:yes stop_codon:yes gene_type:complete